MPDAFGLDKSMILLRSGNLRPNCCATSRLAQLAAQLIRGAGPRSRMASITDALAPSGPGVLQGTEDRYDGVVLDPAHLPSDPEAFTTQLMHSLEVWSAAGKRGIWLQLPLSSVHLVAPAVNKAGFVPHHAESTHIMLVRWLPSSPCTLPPNASHQVGVGAFVVNDRQEVLVVQERNGPLRGMNVWKMPTGLVHQGEDLHTGAEREVLEETGIRARFECVLAVRQAHASTVAAKSDMFLVVGLVPEAGQDVVTHQESELAAAKWMPLSEYVTQPFMQGVELYDTLRERCASYARGTYKGWRGAKLEAGMSRKRSDLLLWGDEEEEEGPSNGTQHN